MPSCTHWMLTIQQTYARVIRGLSYLAPISDLALRLWIARIFWLSGMAKLQSMAATVALFQYLYHVPILPPVFAAYLGTGIELVFPVLLALGLAGRFAAAFLFIYNIITIISYPQMGLSGMLLQAGWGVMMLVTVVRGPGMLSLDFWIQRWLGFPRQARAAVG